MNRPITADFVAELIGRHSITVVDVGARYGAGHSWWRMSPLAKLVGFDPDVEECTRLSRSVPPGMEEQYVPMGLGPQSGTSRLYRTTEPGCSSIYRPRAELIGRYPALACITLTEERDVNVTTLDLWAEQTQTTDIRFLKLDTQGSELGILQGAERVLAGCVGLEVEVEFSELYSGQPLFADVDRFLRARGFVLWRLDDLCYYEEAFHGGHGTTPPVSSDRPRKSNGDRRDSQRAN